MNRKDFFKRLFGAAAIAVVAPTVLAPAQEDGYNIPRKSYLSPGIKNPDDFIIYEYEISPAEVVERYENELTHEQKKMMLELAKKHEGMSFTKFLNIFNK